MAAITVQNVTAETTLTPVFVAASEGGDYFANSGTIMLYVKNAHAVDARTVTIHSQVDCNQGHEHDLTVSVPESSERMVGFLSVGRFNDCAGRVQITYSSEANVTVAAISISK